jgi:hypothetical protein
VLPGHSVAHRPFDGTVRALLGGAAAQHRRHSVSGPRISDHALVRFLERAGGMDVEGVRAALSTSLAGAHAAANRVGGGDHLIVASGMTYVVRGGVVTTCVPRGPAAADAHLLAGSRG